MISSSFPLLLLWRRPTLCAVFHRHAVLLVAALLPVDSLAFRAAVVGDFASAAAIVHRDAGDGSFWGFTPGAVAEGRRGASAFLAPTLHAPFGPFLAIMCLHRHVQAFFLDGEDLSRRLGDG